MARTTAVRLIAPPLLYGQGAYRRPSNGCRCARVRGGLSASALHALDDSRVDRLPARWRDPVVPDDNENCAFTVDLRSTQTLVVHPDSAQGAFEPVGVCGGRCLEAVEAELVLAEVEGIESSSDPLSSEPALRRAVSDGVDELGVGREVRI